MELTERFRLPPLQAFDLGLRVEELAMMEDIRDLLKLSNGSVPATAAKVSLKKPTKVPVKRSTTKSANGRKRKKARLE